MGTRSELDCVFERVAISDNGAWVHKSKMAARRPENPVTSIKTL